MTSSWVTTLALNLVLVALATSGTCHVAVYR